MKPNQVSASSNRCGFWHTNQPTNQNASVERPRPRPSARSVHCFSTYESWNNFSNVLITDNGVKSGIFATTVTCTDTAVIWVLLPRYKNDAYNYQGCQLLDEKLPFFAEVIVKGANLPITLLTPRYSSHNRSQAPDLRLTHIIFI